MKKQASAILKEFGLTDDQILDIAIQERLIDATYKLKTLIAHKWEMDTLTAMRTVHALRAEFMTTNTK